MNMDIDELSMIALYKKENREKTLKSMDLALSAMKTLERTEMEGTIYKVFLSAGRRLQEMSDQDFQTLDFEEALIADEVEHGGE